MSRAGRTVRRLFGAENGDAPAEDEPVRRGWRWRIDVLLLLVVMVPFLMRFGPQVLAAVGGPAFGGLVGRPAPAVEVTTLAGKPMSLASLRGSVVVVNFWATWCGPCLLEMPGFQRAYEANAERGLVIVGLSRDRTPTVPVSVFLTEMGITYPVAMSTDVKTDQAFGGVSVLPSTFLIDRKGIVRHVVRGYFAPPAFEAAIGKLLDER